MASLTVQGDEYIRQGATLIRHYLHEDPTEYDDATFAKRVNEAYWLIKFLQPKHKK